MYMHSTEDLIRPVSPWRLVLQLVLLVVVVLGGALLWVACEHQLPALTTAAPQYSQAILRLRSGELAVWINPHTLLMRSDNRIFEIRAVADGPDKPRLELNELTYEIQSSSLIGQSK